MIRDLIQSATRPKEINAMFRMRAIRNSNNASKEALEVIATKAGDKEFCYEALNKVSRSFAVVIDQLPEELRDSVCVFYLVLRGLDTIEDDMSFPDSEKLPVLRNFHNICQVSGWKIEGVGDSHDYRVLTANFDKIIAVLKSLKPGYREVILDITKRMGNGMADFAELKVNSLADYDKYCHYVAGLVGIGLSGLFSESGLESPYLKDKVAISNSMGLFLQKTNIIRDYHEDLHLGRAFWPSEIWGNYAKEFNEFEKKSTAKNSLACLNHLVTDALRHVPDCIEYLSFIRNKKVFRFCAIPQVMALATLAKVYNNPDVFTGVVKIRKGLAADMMLSTSDLDDVINYFREFTEEIESKLKFSDPNYRITRQRLDIIFALLNEETEMVPQFGKVSPSIA